MRKSLKTILCIMLAAVLLSLAACGENPARTKQNLFTNGDHSLTIPEEYLDLVIVETPLDSTAGVLFSVSERASVEAGMKEGHGKDWGDGWLFSISRIDEEELKTLLCFDMSGQEVFASDDAGYHYVFGHPTDVRFVRESYDNTEADLQQWSMLNEWAFSEVRDAFIAENAGLTPEKRGNSELDIYLYRILYLEGTDYSICATDNDVRKPNGVDAEPFVTRLLDGLELTWVDSGETPDGECVSLLLPDDAMRFDFFLAEGKENYIRRVSSGNEELYLATYADGETKASSVMQEWYGALAEQNG